MTQTETQTESRGETGGAGRLVAVVVTHNRLDQLRVTLERLLASPEARLAAVVVVDNASSDGTGDWLAGLSDPRLDVLASPENLGGAGGFEQGMRRAMERHAPDWLVLMDDDGRPEPGALAAFHGRSREDCDAWLAAVYYPDGRLCEMNRPWINPFWHGSAFLRTLRAGRDGFHMAPGNYSRAEAVPVDGGSFVGLFLSRAAIIRTGYPDGRLFIYGDDVLYTLAVRETGGRIHFDPGLRFEHDCATFENDRARAFRPLWKVYYVCRNGLILYRRAAGWAFWPVLLLVLPKWVAKVRHHRGERGAYLRLLGLAVRHGLRRRTSLSHADLLTWMERKAR